MTLPQSLSAYPAKKRYCARRKRHLPVRLADDLAVVGAFEQREVVGLGFDEVGEPIHQLRSLESGRLAPRRFEAAPGRLDRRIDVAVGSAWNCRPFLAGIGIDRRKSLARRALTPAAAYVELISRSHPALPLWPLSVRQDISARASSSARPKRRPNSSMSASVMIGAGDMTMRLLPARTRSPRRRALRCTAAAAFGSAPNG